MNFADRDDAGRQLARVLKPIITDDGVVVLGLPRGGVPVAAQVAKVLDAPLDVIMVRKLGVPIEPELGMGAIGEDGVRVLNEEVLNITGVTRDQLEAVQAAESAELARRALRYRHGRDRIDLRGRTALVVDDGLATGSTARAACRVARAHGAARIVLAVPVAPRGWTEAMADDADELVCVETPLGFRAIGQFYLDFAQTTDEEVVDCLAEAADRVARQRTADSTSREAPAAAAEAPMTAESQETPETQEPSEPLETPETPETPETSDAPRVADPEVWVQCGRVPLEGALTVPQDATGIVVFAHGSGSSRNSPRNRLVAGALNRAGLATLLFDLLTPEEEDYRRTVFDILMLSRRLSAAMEWLREQPEARDLPVGCFGASTGAAAALWAASEPDSPIAAVVSRGGRPDLAMRRLPAVTAPTLLIVGGADGQCLSLNRQAATLLGGPSRVAIVPDATHLFPEPGALEQVAQLAADWFTEYLATDCRG